MILACDGCAGSGLSRRRIPALVKNGQTYRTDCALPKPVISSAADT
jgi:hypothetical protein